MTITNFRTEGTYREMPYPVMARLPEALPYLEVMYDTLAKEYPAVQLELVGTGTSGATIGTWLQQRSGYKYKYTHVKEKGESHSHRGSIYGSLTGTLVIVDDIVSTGATICHILESIPEKKTVEAIIASWSYFVDKGSAVKRIKAAAFARTITVKNLFVI